ncbi:hypothetical protein COCON_G00074020, partial [Conger conger]
MRFFSSSPGCPQLQSSCERGVCGQRGCARGTGVKAHHGLQFEAPVHCPLPLPGPARLLLRRTPVLPLGARFHGAAAGGRGPPA